MLHLNTIDNTTLKTLLSLLAKDYLRDFALVGGTSLSLRYGHRKSIDIGPVKTDIIYHPFDLLSPVETIEGVRMFSVQDVAAMKLFAICKRGTRKDFYDLWMLVQHFVPGELADFFIEKYGEDKLIFLKKSVLYFEEADDSDQPVVLIPKLTWDKVKKEIHTAFVNL